MTFEDRVRALEPLGFTPPQTRFLVTVALHSGYCLRRQYMTFARIPYGKSTRAFFAKLVSSHLAERIPCRADRGHVYHLFPRRLYRAIGQEDNRNRRETSPALIARKVMLLDCVLGQRHAPWLATEADKVAYFSDTCGIPLLDLPQRCYRAHENATASTTRYFVNKEPIYLTGDPVVAHFVHLVTDATGQGFGQFLADHARVLGRLPCWAIVVTAPAGEPGLRACPGVFARHARALPALVPETRADLRWYFATRRRIESADFRQVSVTDINRFRTLRDTYTTVAHEALYGRWLVQGDRAFDGPTSTERDSARPASGRLLMQPLAHSYSQFCSLPGVA